MQFSIKKVDDCIFNGEWYAIVAENESGKKEFIDIFNDFLLATNVANTMQEFAPPNLKLETLGDNWQ